MKDNYENNIIVDDNRIIYINEIRNKQWAEQFGDVQEYLKKNEFDKVVIDFSRLKWIDPLPLLSIILSLVQKKNTEFELRLPNSGNSNKEQKRLLAFLYSEGFLDQFPENTIVFSGDIIVRDYTFFDKFGENLSYSNCSIIKAIVVDINQEISGSEYTINKWISDIVFSSQSLIKNKVASYRANEVIDRLQSLISETISNVFEHAYPDIDSKYVGLYVRYRRGLSNTRLMKSEYKSLKSLIGLEYENSPKLNRYFIDNLFDFIEVFVVDSGCGFSSNYFREGEEKYPFRKAWKIAVFEGQRGRNKKINKKTQFGGLYTLYKNLGNNFIWARDSNEYIGHEAPSQEEQSYYEIIHNAGKNVDGFSIIYRLTWEIASDIEECWCKIDIPRITEGIALNEHPYYTELKNSISIYERQYKNNISIDDFFVIDERMPILKKISAKIYKTNNKNYSNCFYFPAKYMSKTEIYESVLKNFIDIIVDSRSLIICDIYAFEANRFQLALENASFPERFTNNIDKIILVSVRFSVLCLGKDANTKKYKRTTSTLNKSLNDNLYLPQYYIADLIAWIRTHDSMLFWKLVKNKSGKYNLLYVNGKIEWYGDSNDYEMNGYLNFAQIISDSDIRKLMECQLNRISCLASHDSPNSVEFLNIDILTTQLSSKMNTYFEKDVSWTDDNITKILLGSVFVSGISQYDKAHSIVNERHIPIHFFIHKSVINKKSNKKINTDKISQAPHLLLWPKDWLNRNFPFDNTDYRRVGRSHVIAPYGWKYYPIPRYRIFDKTQNKFVSDISSVQNKAEGNYEFICAYGDEPENTYKEWQLNPQIIEIGHYSYENKHDLFKIDLSLAVQESFNVGGRLAIFLLAEILMALDLKSSSIVSLPEYSKSIYKSKTSVSNSIFDKRLQNLKKRVDKYIEDNATGSEKCAIIAYPSHYNTENIIGKIKETIDTKQHNRIVTLIPINKERGSSAYLISPLILEDVRNKIIEYRNNHKVVNVLLFDDATVDGKARKELKHLLFYLGADNVKTLCIIDRRRLPFSTTIPDKHKAFWRMDVPRIGNRGECSLCEALKSISTFHKQLIYTTHKLRIKKWEEGWSCRFPYSKSDTHGISPKPLINTIKKKFSLYIDKETGESVHCNQVNLINSIGLTLYIAEIHSMTARHDLAIKLFKDSSIENIIKIEILAINLLLFNKDYSGFILSEMTRLLFKSLNSEKQESNETALAVLTILSLPFNVTSKVLIPLIEQNIEINNKDVNLLLSYFVNLENERFKDNHLQGNFFNSYSKDEKTAYSKLHHEIYNDFGINHNKAFQKILKLNEASIIVPSLIDEGISSCNRLYAIIKGFPIGNTRTVFKQIELLDISDTLNNADRVLQSHYDIIIKNNAPKYYSDNKKIYYNLLDVKKIIQTAFEKIYKFHSNVFVNIGIREQGFPIESIISEIIIDYNAKHKDKVSFANSFKKDVGVENEKWIPFDRHIAKKIEYIFTNSRHSLGFIDKYLNYYAPDLKNEEGHFRMVLSIDYIETGVNLIFINHSDKTADMIKHEAEKKKKLEKEHILKLGGFIDYKHDDFSEGVYLIKTILFLPYI